jgi:hypothetical protein
MSSEDSSHEKMREDKSGNKRLDHTGPESIAIPQTTQEGQVMSKTRGSRDR